MGKKRRLNKLISKWIKSDLPEERSSVLLLKVTNRTSSNSPKPQSRRPFSFPFALEVVSSCSKAQVRRKSSNARRTSVFKEEELLSVPTPHHYSEPEKSFLSFQNVDDDLQENGSHTSSNSRNLLLLLNSHENNNENSHLYRSTDDDTISSKNLLEVKINGSPPSPQLPKLIDNNNLNNSDIICIRKVINDRRSAFLNSTLFNSNNNNNNLLLLEQENFNFHSNPSVEEKCASCNFCKVEESKKFHNNINMETSVDSIGNCSLDMDTSRELNSSDWTTEVGSTVTLQGSNNQDHHHHQHLPSYLSLACTVNGYSTTTNYDSIRLSARSRDASPHRMIIDHQNEKHQLNFSVTNNNNNLLLSPPNLVPLPSSITPKIMHSSVAAAAAAEDGLIKTATQSSATKKMFSYNSYTTNNTVKIITNELTHLKLTTNAKDATDDVDRKITTNSRELFNSYTYHQNENAQTICNEKKSFIQQRVERLYGPGALAQGFFVTTKRQRNRNNSECTDADLVKTDEFHHSLNKTLPDKLSDEENIEPTSSTSSTNNLKQSSSISSSFPSVFRHLRPEFRAQLPCLASPKKVADTVLMQQKQKSVTVPKLLVKNDIQIINNGKVKENDDDDAVTSIIIGGFKQNGNKSVNVEEDEKDLKDGHYFLRILDEQTVRLLKLAEKIDDDLLNLPNLSEEIIGQLRSASGKARLLVSQKMQQFKGLCTNNINQGLGEAYPTTNEDLQGFWDMVMLQIDQVDKLFEEIDKLRMNNWILDEEEETKRTEIKTNGTAKPRKSNSKPKLSAAAEEARKQREEQRRKLIEERRKAMKTAQESKNNNHHHHHQPNIKIFVPESS